MKLIAPDRCPFCGSFTVDGTFYSAKYECGSSVWIAQEDHVWVLHGYEGSDCLLTSKGLHNSPPVE